MKYLYQPPKLFELIFPNIFWRTSNETMLLTFDDSPNPNITEMIIEILDKNKIKACFFCVGEKVEKYPGLISQIDQSGHIAANHSYSHPNFIKLRKKDKLAEVVRTKEIIEKITGKENIYFRPPFGRFDLTTLSILNEIKMKNVMWSLFPYDYKNDLNIVKFAVNKYLKNNSIVVFHDKPGNNILEKSLNYLIEEAEKKGYKFGDPAGCLKS